MSELLGANVDVLDRVAESLSTHAQRMSDISALARRAMFELQAGWNGPDLFQLSDQWERLASPRLAETSALLARCAVGLRAQAGAQRHASASTANGGGGVGSVGAGGVGDGRVGAGGLGDDRAGGGSDGGGSGPTPSTTVGSPAVPVPPSGQASPGDNARWWASLTDRQQRLVVEQHPEWIGNRDGVAFTVRDQANRSLVDVHRRGLLEQQRSLAEGLADNWFGGVFTNNDAALDDVNDKLAALAEIDRTLAKSGNRQLLLLDLSAERAQAAISRGDADAAKHVAVFIPGLSASVSGALKVYDDTMGQLQRRAELEGKRLDPTAPTTVAVVTWIGYQAPQMGWDLLGRNSVASDHAARSGAAVLVPFLQGIDAVRDDNTRDIALRDNETREDDVHLTLLGHSYGSTLAGLALQQETGVNDVVFFGSPGVGTSNLPDLRLDGGQAYYIEARRDVVGDLGYFGTDPSHVAGITQASAQEATVIDKVADECRRFKEVVGHSSYLEDYSTSQYNMAVVVAGVPDRQFLDDGEGFGDVLSRPLLGTG